MMKYKIVEARAFNIVGLKADANFVTNGQVTSQLARGFMPRLKDIKSLKDPYTLSLQKYEDFNFKNFNPSTSFEKWIGVEVDTFDAIPEDLETLTIPSGNYLVIDFKGSIPEFIKQWQYIHSTWLPKSEFELDHRPHFERLPPSYNPANQDNDEEIWIPIK
ncbi:GyrI-like domain-containing protein [Winogradskyella sp.]|uniref:GyrI-like domain-containing protein n=1 Tax=Winogradskyella sp. TaxID=1883156 RepID=UPI0025D1681A|nr:GyrI-like domain-containing protein [Winogradskyella sp.]